MIAFPIHLRFDFGVIVGFESNDHERHDLKR